MSLFFLPYSMPFGNIRLIVKAYVNHSGLARLGCVLQRINNNNFVFTDQDSQRLVQAYTRHGQYYNYLCDESQVLFPAQH